MIKTIFGKKLETNQGFDKQAKRWPLTKIRLLDLTIVQIKTKHKDGYNAVQVSIGKKKDSRREIRLKKPNKKLKKGRIIKPSQVLKPGDQIKVSGKSKGKGFTGVIKRWGFKGGPRTHGQSDRERAPGSIGQRTDPGRVWKGKKMAGHSGNRKTTIRNLAVMQIDEQAKLLIVRGLVPGPRNTLLKIKKTGEVKNFSPFKEINVSPVETEKKA